MIVSAGDYFQFAVRIAVGFFFIFAGFIKIMDPVGFASSIYNYRLLPDSVIGLAAVTVPWIELLSGTALLLGVKLKSASLSTASLLALFILALLVSAARGLNVDCTCFSGASLHTGRQAIAKDLSMLAGALFIYFFDHGRISLARRYAKRKSS